MAKNTKRDTDLEEAAVRKAGGASALANLLGVTPGAVSQWGRTRSIPRHARPRLEDYVKPNRSVAAEEPTEPPQAPLSPPVRTLLSQLERDLSSTYLADLPRQYRKRYEERVAEVITRVRRELEEYQKVLEAEQRAKPAKRKTPRKRGEQ